MLRSKINQLKTLKEALVLAGMKEDDRTIGNVFETISEEDTMDVTLAAAINVVEVEETPGACCSNA